MMKPDDTIEFSYLTRFLTSSEYLELQMNIARRYSEGDSEALIAYAFVRDISKAAEKYPAKLKEVFSVNEELQQACIKIRNDVENIEMKKNKSNLFKQQSSFNKDQLLNVFKKFATKISPKKTLR